MNNCQGNREIPLTSCLSKWTCYFIGVGNEWWFQINQEKGIRLEKEFTEKTQIVHLYDFSGSGFEMSWGAGQLVLKLPSKL